MSRSLHEAARRTGRVIYLELLVLVLSLWSLGALSADLLLPLDPATRELLARLDLLVCGVFLFDFAVHLWRAPDKGEFLKWGWIDLLSSIPAIGWLRWGRLFRVVRILRALRSYNAVAEHLAFDRPRGTFGAVSIISALATLISTIAVLHFEKSDPEANIRSAGDALWWAFATITTIGYGDRFPVTVPGRIVAVLLVICGLSIFATFTAYIASFFLGKGQKREEVELHHVLAEVKLVRQKLEAMEAASARPPAAKTPPP